MFPAILPLLVDGNLVSDFSEEVSSLNNIFTSIIFRKEKTPE